MSNAEFKEELQQDRLVEDIEAVLDAAVESHTADSNSTKTAIGAVIGQHYEIVELLGEGGMSKVYKARHMILNEPVALKLISSHFTNEAKTLMRFRQEALAATHLKHPNICGVREFGVDNGSPFLVMDFIDGTSIDDILTKEKRIDHQRALQLVLDVCEGLEYAHKKDVIHRDIKPANLIVKTEKDGSTSVEIVDFGIAKLIREDDSGPNLTATGEVFGTPNYMSPEQCLGKSVDKRSDIYSLGCVLFHLVSGRAPFASNSVLETLMKQVKDDPEYLNNVPGSVNAIIQKCTRKAAADRYQSMAELKSDIKKVLAGEPISTTVSKPKRSPLLLALIWIVVVCTSGVVINNIIHSNSQNTSISSSQESTGPTLTANSEWAKKHHQADLLHRKGDTARALPMYEEAYDTAKKSNAAPRELTYLAEEMAGCARYLNDGEKAIKYYGLAADQAKNIGDYDWQQRLLGGLARSEFEQKQYDKGLNHYEEILRIQTNAVGDDPVIMEYWLTVGTAYMDAGRPAQAESYFKKTLELGTRYPGSEHKTVALAHYQLGRIADLNGQMDVAKQEYETALKLGRLAWLQNDDMTKIQDALSKLKK